METMRRRLHTRMWVARRRARGRVSCVTVWQSGDERTWGRLRTGQRVDMWEMRPPQMLSSRCQWVDVVVVRSEGSAADPGAWVIAVDSIARTDAGGQVVDEWKFVVAGWVRER